MLSFLHNHRVGTRLGAGFAILLLLITILGGVSLLNLTRIQDRLDEIVLDNSAKTGLIQTMLINAGQKAVLMHEIVLRADAEFAGQQVEPLARLADEIDRAMAELETLPASDEGRALRDRTIEARAATATIYDEVLRLAMEGDDRRARIQLLVHGTPAMLAWEEPLRENLQLQMASNAEVYQLAHAQYDRALTLMAAIIVAALAIGAALAWLITQSLTRPLGFATRVAREIAGGKLDREIRVTGTDELATLLASMRDMQDGLQRFAEAQGEIARQHEAGEIDHRIPAADFPGAYGEMAGQINTLVASHIAIKFRVIDIVGRYAKGDLSEDIERLPGKKARITTAVDAVKSTTQAVTAEIRTLVEAAVAGDFSRRGNADEFQFVYREMIENLNKLMVSADHGIGEVGALMSAVAEGDLTRRADANLPGQFGQLAADANGTVEQLALIVGRIREGSDAISSAASEIAAGNTDLSRRTEQQAASLEETASSMEELTSTVRQNADNARQANQLAIGAADVAGKGGEVVGQVVQTMTGINASSRKIVDIISVIDGIAFQTNILALNAAVEAARAGEQGRGFAVVASEVRTLAQRSAAAAKEIKGLIDDSVAKVEDGTALVDQAGRTMGEIVTSVKRVTDIIAEISAASQEQSSGIQQVSQVVTHMDEGTQQNAALVEEASAAARALEQQSGVLVQTVAAFRLGSGDVAATGAATAAASDADTHRPAAEHGRRPALVTADWNEF